MSRERKKRKRLPLFSAESDENILALGSAKLSRKTPEVDILKEQVLTNKESWTGSLSWERGAGLPSVPLLMRPRASGQSIT